ncbi:twin-arginine translocation signal domain-containing protein [Halomicroarcula sp. F28]|nr:twin-arginine translocation signal domain-containing protein [Halomicroarcula salinisoli]
MDRRSFLATTAILGGWAGCSSTQTTTEPKPSARTAKTPEHTARVTQSETATATPGTPERDRPTCVEPTRPDPDSGSGAVDPVSYPETRPEVSESSAMAEYIAAYETAYRTNWLLEEHGSELTDVYFGVGEPTYFDSLPASVTGRLRYTYGFELESAIADSPTIYASYYVDDAVVVRAEHRGWLRDEDVLEPNPLDSGHVLECFVE